MGTLKSSLLLIVTVVLTSLSLVTVEAKTHWQDVEVLKQLKNGIEASSVSPGSCLSSWDFSVDPCDSLFSEKFTCGFRCDLLVSGMSRVTEVSLDQAGYSGSLSSISWNLPYLQTLDLSSNNFYGQIPESFSNLTRLTRLGLSRNWFSNNIPTSIGSLTKLEELYLDNNILQGTIPASINGLISLKRLEIQSNKLYGEFPELGSLKNLYFLDASDNAISGKVPYSLPSSLVQISMRNNTLQGTIPESFKNLVFLQVLDLSHNKLSGLVPSLLFTHPSLQQLTLSFNYFTSVQSPSPFSLPSSPIQSELIAMDLSNNQLQGFLPSFLPLMPKLSALSLENNKFTGMIPTQFAIKAAASLIGSGFSPFARLLLGGNYLFGPIPVQLIKLQPGSVDVRLNDNCLYRCPTSFFFCQGGVQKSLMECKSFSPFIP
ncbi:receptor-like protein 53 [Ricinus communis]|uniref:Serine-threonine protein kinase, plant-type, putative n=1 Tax=Ricinus communis TaxID=3988 RepID=B9T4Y3_RICCO|nr:receptor-like protein 53 [Ricinus communis]EEF29079.1 serine-threonine protein kinase, plant-type, putative [Ricinus communis]|eukprot:XP_002533302.1 LRR receptor-like serine/threonine-protein kinase FLS2 [Ricinus communis]